MRIPEDSELMMTDKQGLDDTTTKLDKSMTILLGIIILLIYMYWVLITI
jgi:hypothetical protein